MSRQNQVIYQLSRNDDGDGHSTFGRFGIFISMATKRNAEKELLKARESEQSYRAECLNAIRRASADRSAVYYSQGCMRETKIAVLWQLYDSENFDTRRWIAPRIDSATFNVKTVALLNKIKKCFAEYPDEPPPERVLAVLDEIGALHVNYLAEFMDIWVPSERTISPALETYESATDRQVLV